MIASSCVFASAGSAGSGSSASKISGFKVVEGISGGVEAAAVAARQQLFRAGARTEISVPIRSACCRPCSERPRCVEQSSTSKLPGSPVPGDMAWRISTTCPPSRNSAQPASVAAAGVSSIAARTMRTRRSIRPSLLIRPHIGMRKLGRKQDGREGVAASAWRCPSALRHRLPSLDKLGREAEGAYCLASVCLIRSIFLSVRSTSGR